MDNKKKLLVLQYVSLGLFILTGIIWAVTDKNAGSFSVCVPGAAANIACIIQLKKDKK